jgi:hypothetical protein
MDLPTKPECSWDCEGCILCESPIPTLNNEDNEDNDNNEDNEEESWENDEFIDKLKTEIRTKEEKIRTKEEDKLYLEKLKQKKESLEFHKYIRRRVLHAKENFNETYYRNRNCSKLFDVWTDLSFIELLKEQCMVYFINNVYYDIDNYKEYLFCNKEDCCCKKALKFIDIKHNIENFNPSHKYNKKKDI